MKHDQLLAAIGNIDDKYLIEADVPAAPARPLRRWLIAAACLALICVGAAIWARPSDAPAPVPDIVQEQVENAACEAATEDAMRAELQHTDAKQIAEVNPAEIPIAGNTALYLLDYSCVSAEAQEVLLRYQGEAFIEVEGKRWYRMRDTNTLKNLICEADDELQLWRFMRFAEPFAVGDVYAAVFGMEKAEDLTAITVNGDTLWDTGKLQQFYELTKDVVCTDMGLVLANAVPLYPFSASLYSMDGWLYDPVAGVLSIYGATSDPLDTETVQALNSILGIE